MSVHHFLANNRDVTIDTAKASLPIGGGISVQFLKLREVDEWIIVMTHGIGLAAAVIGLAWYVYRIIKDVRMGRDTTATITSRFNNETKEKP